MGDGYNSPSWSLISLGSAECRVTWGGEGGIQSPQCREINVGNTRLVAIKLYLLLRAGNKIWFSLGRWEDVWAHFLTSTACHTFQIRCNVSSPLTNPKRFVPACTLCIIIFLISMQLGVAHMVISANIWRYRLSSPLPVHKTHTSLSWFSRQSFRVSTRTIHYLSLGLCNPHSVIKTCWPAKIYNRTCFRCVGYT